MAQSLSAHLTSLDPEAFRSATQAKFLENAGNGTLSKELLQEWLAQDRLYAQAYLRFASLLLANVPLPSTVSANHINERLADLIIEAITNIRQELKFFEDVAQRYGLALEASVVSRGVQSYRALFTDIGEGIEKDTHGLLSGMVLLWGTEKCYLEAWKYASTFSSMSPMEADLDGGALRREFIPNWTSDEFVRFVDRCENLMDEIWDGQHRDRNSELLMRGMWWGRWGGADREQQKAEWLAWVGRFWQRILYAEEIFWVKVGDD